MEEERLVAAHFQYRQRYGICVNVFNNSHNNNITIVVYERMVTMIRSYLFGLLSNIRVYRSTEKVGSDCIIGDQICD